MCVSCGGLCLANVFPHRDAFGQLSLGQYPTYVRRTVFWASCSPDNDRVSCGCGASNTHVSDLNTCPCVSKAVHVNLVTTQQRSGVGTYPSGATHILTRGNTWCRTMKVALTIQYSGLHPTLSCMVYSPMSGMSNSVCGATSIHPDDRVSSGDGSASSSTSPFVVHSHASEMTRVQTCISKPWRRLRKFLRTRKECVARCFSTRQHHRHVLMRSPPEIGVTRLRNALQLVGKHNQQTPGPTTSTMRIVTQKDTRQALDMIRAV